MPARATTPTAARIPPLYTATTFGFPDTEAVLDAVEGRSDASLYTRYGMNPTIRALEAKLAGLEEPADLVADLEQALESLG